MTNDAWYYGARAPAVWQAQSHQIKMEQPHETTAYIQDWLALWFNRFMN